MTLLLVFHASDGLLLMADGRRTKDPGLHNGEPFILLNDARKTAVAPTGLAVAMAAGHSVFGEEVAADVFEAAMRDAINGKPLAAVDDGTYWQPTEPGSVEHLARACLGALKTRWTQLSVDGRATRGIVAGYDPDSTTSSVYTFTVGAGVQGPAAEDVAAQSILAIPLDLDDDVGHIVRSRFGLMSPMQLADHLDQLDREPDLPFPESYTLQGRSLDAVFTEVAAVMPELIAQHGSEFDSAGVGGDWVAHLVRPGVPVTTIRFDWGPTRPVNSPA